MKMRRTVPAALAALATLTVAVATLGLVVVARVFAAEEAATVVVHLEDGGRVLSVKAHAAGRRLGVPADVR